MLIVIESYAFVLLTARMEFVCKQNHTSLYTLLFLNHITNACIIFMSSNKFLKKNQWKKYIEDGTVHNMVCWRFVSLNNKYIQEFSKFLFKDTYEMLNSECSLCLSWYVYQLSKHVRCWCREIYHVFTGSTALYRI